MQHTNARADGELQVDLKSLIRMPQLRCQMLASILRLFAEVKLRVFKIRFNIDHLPALNRAQCQRLAGPIPHPLSICFTPIHYQSGLGRKGTRNGAEYQVKGEKCLGFGDCHLVDHTVVHHARVTCNKQLKEKYTQMHWQ